MDKDIKIIIGSVIIIVVTALFSNYGSTGAVVRDLRASFVDIRISPNVIHAGDVMYIDIYSGSKGINNRADFVYAIDDLRKGSKQNICGDGDVCVGDVSFSYVTSLTWEPGIYKIVLYDYDTESFVEERITVV